MNNTKLSNSFKNVWVWTLLACAVGAGILYLPINAGLHGIWPFIILIVITFPIVYLAHLNLTRFVLIASTGTTNINDIVYENFSKKFYNTFSICYFLAIYPMILIYTVGLTNTVDSFLITNFALVIPRAILAFLLLACILSIVISQPDFIRKVIKYLALPLASILFLLSVYLIPKWQFQQFEVWPNTSDLFNTLFITLPVIIFTVNYSPIISTFALYHSTHSQSPEQDTTNILWRSSLLIFGFSMFFVFSCIMAVDPNNMTIAKAANANILVYMSTLFDDPILRIVNPLIAMTAMTGACFSSFFGAKESVIGLIEQSLHVHKVSSKKLDYLATAIILIPCYIFAVLNTSILAIMSALSGPIIALLLFIFPIYAIYHIPKLEKHHITPWDRFNNFYVLTIGLISFSAILYSFKYLIFYLM
ncbi:MAG: hypothetical protein KBD64_05565 [Gammaproteobacteria bacterium]|nr:hypothetical protein [Gammaproteobacteria bacterium]